MEGSHRFDEDGYLEANPDVAHAVADGTINSGEAHYRQFGKSEGRGLRGRTDPKKGHILISGTGRTGTTFLVQIFTTLGFDTGFSISDAMTSVDAVSHAGLEHRLSSQAPLVVKSPWLVETLGNDLASEDYRVAFAILPIRNLKDAADSRRRVAQIAVEQGHDPMDAAGGLWLTSNPVEQESILLTKFYDIVLHLVAHNIRPIFVHFPRFALDVNYLYRTLQDVWGTYGVSESELRSVFLKTVDPEKINFR